MRAPDRQKCTGLYGVPTMFIAELMHPSFSTFNLSSLRTGIMAGSVCPMETMKAVRKPVRNGVCGRDRHSRYRLPSQRSDILEPPRR